MAGNEKNNLHDSFKQEEHSSSNVVSKDVFSHTEIKPIKKSNQLNLILACIGIIFSISVLYFTYIKRNFEQDIQNEKINNNELPALDNSVTNNNTNDNENIINKNNSENNELIQYELGNYVVDGDELGRAYFHDYPNQSTRRNAFVVTGEFVYILKAKNGFGYVEFVNPKGKKSKGWLKLNLLTFYNN